MLRVRVTTIATMPATKSAVMLPVSLNCQKKGKTGMIWRSRLWRMTERQPCQDKPRAGELLPQAAEMDRRSPAEGVEYRADPKAIASGGGMRKKKHGL